MPHATQVPDPALRKKQSLAWLWILLGVLAAGLIGGAIVLLAVVVPAMTAGSSSDDAPLASPTASAPGDDDAGTIPQTAQEAMVAGIHETFPDWELTEAQILEIGQSSCRYATEQGSVDADLVAVFARDIAQTYAADRYDAAAPGTQHLLEEEAAFMGEFGTLYLCDEYYSPWYDAVTAFAQP